MTLWDLLLHVLAVLAIIAQGASTAALLWWVWLDHCDERDWQRAERKRQGGGG